MAEKNVRSMKVCGQSGYKYETVPAITLKGKWLEIRYKSMLLADGKVKVKTGDNFMQQTVK